MKAENVFFVGSPIVAIGSTLSEKKFSQYICIEADESRKIALEKRAAVACKNFETCEARIFHSDTNVELGNILREYCQTEKTCYLAFVDPQRINDLKWSTLHTLFTYGKGDLIINFPTMAIVRNLRNPESANAITNFIGDPSWSQIEPTAEAILEYFESKIAEYRSKVDSLPVKDEQDHRLYDLIFATNSQGMKNVLDDLKNRLNKIKTKDIRGLYSVAKGDQSQLTGFT